MLPSSVRTHAYCGAVMVPSGIVQCTTCAPALVVLSQGCLKQMKGPHEEFILSNIVTKSTPGLS
jgi:aerobic-type carbon monoxide dehydrogenase small subunit (CoxS/CutS family)